MNVTKRLRELGGHGFARPTVQGFSPTATILPPKIHAGLPTAVREHNGVKVVIVERADRLARDLMIGEIVLDQFRRAGVRVLTADGADLTTNDNPTTVMVRQILGAVAQFDKSITVAKLRAARQRLRAKGRRVEGRKPYGTHPNERALVDRMRMLRRKPVKGDRLSYAAIAADLNAEGHTTRYGRPWTRDGVCKALGRR